MYIAAVPLELDKISVYDPGAAAGLVNVAWYGLTTVTDAKLVPPTMPVKPAAKPVPVTTTVCPPAGFRAWSSDP